MQVFVYTQLSVNSINFLEWLGKQFNFSLEINIYFSFLDLLLVNVICSYRHKQNVNHGYEAREHGVKFCFKIALQIFFDCICKAVSRVLFNCVKLKQKNEILKKHLNCLYQKNCCLV